MMGKRGPKPGTRKGIPSKLRGTGQYYQWLKDRVGYTGAKCLIWPGTTNWNGYGTLGVNGKLQYAHRTMCELVNGPPPTPKHVAAHSCHNGRGSCVHPQHLSWKTPRENMLERQNIPDGQWGTRRTNLPPEHIARIIELKGKMNQREIGLMFGISYQHVSVIQNRKLVSQ